MILRIATAAILASGVIVLGGVDVQAADCTAGTWF